MSSWLSSEPYGRFRTQYARVTLSPIWEASRRTKQLISFITMEIALLLPVLILSLAFAVGVLLYSVEKVAGRRISFLRRKGTHPASPVSRSPGRASSSGKLQVYCHKTMTGRLAHHFADDRVPLVGPLAILFLDRYEFQEKVINGATLPRLLQKY